jgi:hypothetical protein
MQKILLFACLGVIIAAGQAMASKPIQLSLTSDIGARGLMLLRYLGTKQAVPEKGRFFLGYCAAGAWVVA